VTFEALGSDTVVVRVREDLDAHSAADLQAQLFTVIDGNFRTSCSTWPTARSPTPRGSAAGRNTQARPCPGVRRRISGSVLARVLRTIGRDCALPTVGSSAEPLRLVQ
jgi:hypothetical protein